MSRLAVYPGSFDPPTLGHLDVIERAAKQFDEIVVSVGINTSKSAMLSPDERAAVLWKCCAHLGNVRVATFSGLLIDHAIELGAGVIVRGLRATADFEYEFQMAMVNRRLAPELETVFLMTTWEHSYLSSSIVREVANLGGDYSGLVPPAVAEAIAEALSRESC